MPDATLAPDPAAVARAQRVSVPRGNGRPIAPPRSASVLGLGHYPPEEIVPNDPIAARIGVDDEWIVKRTGIRARHRASPDERLTGLATRAGHKALHDALVDPGDVDLGRVDPADARTAARRWPAPRQPGAAAGGDRRRLHMGRRHGPVGDCRPSLPLITPPT